jgi:hypothetical protein
VGCDIHSWCEVRKLYPNRQAEASGKWAVVGAVFDNIYAYEDTTPVVNEYWIEHAPKYDDTPGATNDAFYEYEPPASTWGELKSVSPYDGRNYDLFAMLADVRNGRGFAGCNTGDGFTPISEPKGVPDDASAYYKWQANRYGVDGHSHSWLTLAELKAYDWHGQFTHKRGWVAMDEYKTFLEKGHPESWSGGVSGGSVKHVTNAEMDKLIADGVNSPGLMSGPHDFTAPHYYTQVEWKIAYAESADWFLEHSIPVMEKLAGNSDVLGGAEGVRMVFFFDN